MGIIVGVLSGLIGGFLVGIWACLDSENRQVQNRIFTHKGKVYRLTEINPDK